MARSSGTWTKGQSGNPRGMVRHRPFAAYLREALETPYDHQQSRYQRVAAVVVEQALAGDMAAIRLLIDRLDGAIAPNTALLEAREAQAIMHEVLPLFRGRGYTPEMLGRALTVLRAAVSPESPEDDGEPVVQVNGAAHAAHNGAYGALTATVGQKE